MKTLKQLRQDNGVTQEELARRIQGIRGGKAFQGPVSAIESNRNSPTVSRLKDTLNALGFDLSLCATRDRESIPIDLESLLGTASRAKDT
jgi:transcriptional regulator with XRE-family HTH domain